MERDAASGAVNLITDMDWLLQKLRAPGGRVFLLFLVTLGIGAGWEEPIVRRVAQKLSWLAEPDAQERANYLGILRRADAIPQGFNAAENEAQGRSLLHAFQASGAMAEVRAFHRADRTFMLCYFLLGVAVALWLKASANALAASTTGSMQRIGRWFAGGGWLLPLIFAGLLATADLCEYFVCRTAMGGAGNITDGLMHAARTIRRLKDVFAVLAALSFLAAIAIRICVPAARVWLRESWELMIAATRLAMRVRFSILGVVLFGALLASPPGQDIIRTLASGPFAPERPLTKLPVPDVARMAWFVLGICLLAATCQGWAYILYAFSMLRPENRPRQRDVEHEQVLTHLRQGLPSYYGVLPFVTAAGAFAVAPLGEKNVFPALQILGAGFFPLAIVFLVPFLVIVRRLGAGTNIPEPPAFGPLAGSLTVATILALVHAGFSLHAGVGVIVSLMPAVLLTVAMLVIALQRGWGLALLALFLLIAWLLHFGDTPGGSWKPLWPMILVIGIAAVMAIRLGRPSQWPTPLQVAIRLPYAAYWHALFQRLKAERQIQAMLEGSEEDTAYLQQHRGLPVQSHRVWAQTLVKALRSVQILALILIAIQALLFCLVVFAGHPFSAALGSGAMLAAGFGAWICLGSAIMFWTQAARFPVLTTTFLWIILCSAVMDNHGVRIAAQTPSAPVEIAKIKNLEPVKEGETGRKPVREAFEKWAVQPKLDARRKAPCIIVATEGGGIRAAFWTATVLATLQDASRKYYPEEPDFADHVFAISGVSGGSVGAAFFTALCADRGTLQSDMRELVARMLARDHLAPVLGGLLYPDFFQRMLPVEIFQDRAAYLEGGWENAWSRVMSKEVADKRAPAEAGSRMAQPFLSLWPTATDRGWVPALFLNSTMVETGQRAICTNLAVTTGPGGAFADAHDLHAHLRSVTPGAGAWQDIPLSTAAHTSARFPVFSPPGRLPSGLRVVDGGYFENSAAATGFELLAGLDESFPDRPYIFLFLRFGPEPAFSDLVSCQQHYSRLVPRGQDFFTTPELLFNETSGVLGTAMKTRDARGSWAQDTAAGRYEAVHDGVIRLSFTFGGDDIPLSWALSRESCVATLKQMPMCTKAPGETKPAFVTEKGANDLAKANAVAANELFRYLYEVQDKK